MRSGAGADGAAPPRQAIWIFEEVDEKMAEGLTDEEFTLAMRLIRRMQQNLGGRPPQNEDEGERT